MQPHRLLAAFAAGALSLAIAMAPAMAAERIVVGQTFIADGTDPGRGANGWSLTTHGVGEALFTVDRDGRVVPLLATSVVPDDGMSWLVKLRPDRRFADGSPVTANDVAASLGRTNATNPAAQASAGHMAFQVIDTTTLRITPERPVPVMASVLAEWPMVVYKTVGDSHVFSGPFAVADFAPGDGIDLVPNPHYPGAARRPEILVKKFADAQSLALAFEAGELDLAFNLPSETVARLGARDGLTVKSFPVGYQYMMWMNTLLPMLADARVRQALDLALDRAMLVEAINGGSVASGAFADYFPFAGAAPRPHDKITAAALLDAAGWATGADGFRAKNGVRLTVTLTAYPQRPDLVTLQPVIKALYREIGVAVETRVSEAVTQVANAGDFELLLWAQHSAPAGDPAFFLNMFLRSGAGNNHAGYSSPRYEALLDALTATADPGKRAAFARAAQQILFDDAPVSFLLTPNWHVGLSSRLAHYEPWGSDYYIIRPDLTVAE